MLLADTSLHSWLELIAFTLMPILVGLVTKMSTHPGVKATLLLGLSAVTGFVTEWAHAAASHAVDFSLGRAVMNLIIGFVVAVAVQRGLYRPTGLSAAASRTLVTDREGPDGTAHANMRGDSGYTNLVLLLVVLIVLFAIFGGIYLNPFVWLILILAAILLFTGV